MVEGVGFEPTKAEPSDLQSGPFGRSGTPPARANVGGTFSLSDPSMSNEPFAKWVIVEGIWCRHKELNPGPSHYK